MSILNDIMLLGTLVSFLVAAVGYRMPESQLSNWLLGVGIIGGVVGVFYILFVAPSLGDANNATRHREAVTADLKETYGDQLVVTAVDGTIITFEITSSANSEPRKCDGTVAQRLDDKWELELKNLTPPCWVAVQNIVPNS